MIQSVRSAPASSSTDRVSCNSQVTLWVNATDEDQDTLKYIWNAEKGSFVYGRYLAAAIWQPPQVTGAEDDSISVRVSDGIAADTSSIIVYVNPAPPQAPTLSAPANFAIRQSVSPTLGWNTSRGATSYALQVWVSGFLGRYVYDGSGIAVTTQQVTELNNGTTYDWRVNAKNSYGNSGWSTVWSFTTVGSMGSPCPETLRVVYAGKTYHTVQIGSQCWLRENLDVGEMIDSSQVQSNNSTIEKYCYNNDTANCRIYGGLYQWNEAMQYDTVPGKRGICPTGWHIPALSEFQTLGPTAGGDGNALKAEGQGSGDGAGTNRSGFSALLAGYRYANGYFYDAGASTRFWSSTESFASAANYMVLDYGSSAINLYYYYEGLGFSVRCIKD